MILYKNVSQQSYRLLLFRCKNKHLIRKLQEFMINNFCKRIFPPVQAWYTHHSCYIIRLGRFFTSESFIKMKKIVSLHGYKLNTNHMTTIHRYAIASLLMISGITNVSAQHPTASGLSPERFDSIMDGKSTGLYTIRNNMGMEACITNYGARLVSLIFEGKDCVTGFDNVGDYRTFKQNYGATVGRYAGRIKGARFKLDGVEYHLQENGNGVTSHGGYPGFADHIWTVTTKTDSTLTLQYVSADGENGFPGELTVDLTYTVSSRNGLEVSYEATTTKPTVINLTNHSFFNIGGRLDREITDELLWVNSDRIATFDTQKNLNGRMMKVKGTPFDFRKARRIGERIDEDNEQLKITKGYDHSFVLKTKGNDHKPAAIVTDQERKVQMTVYTTEPVLHIYTGNGLKGNTRGKQDICYPRRSAICLEAMHLADSPNQPRFPSTVLRPGDTFRSHTAYVFSKVE